MKTKADRIMERLVKQDAKANKGKVLHYDGVTMPRLVDPEPLTDVVFRRWHKRSVDNYNPNYPGNVIALFPTVPFDTSGRLCSSYEHVGQHAGASYSGCIGLTTPVDLYSPDVIALKSELESIGYRLRVLKRSPPWRKVSEARRLALG